MELVWEPPMASVAVVVASPGIVSAAPTEAEI
jgi:hypothetical protein